MSANRDALFEWVAGQHARWLDLYLAGQVFGGRPGDAPLELLNATFDGTTARLYFDDGEMLTVEQPSGFIIADGRLTVPVAAEVRFGWSFGLERTRDNWSELVYTLSNEEVSVTSSGPAANWNAATRFPLAKQSMVRLA